MSVDVDELFVNNMFSIDIAAWLLNSEWIVLLFAILLCDFFEKVSFLRNSWYSQ